MINKKYSYIFFIFAFIILSFAYYIAMHNIDLGYNASLISYEHDLNIKDYNGIIYQTPESMYINGMRFIAFYPILISLLLLTYILQYIYSKHYKNRKI